MLDPDEREELRRTPGLSYQSSGVAYSSPSPSRGAKTSGMSSPDDSSQDSSSVGSDGWLGSGNLSFSPGEEDYDDFNEGEKTDQEVSKYSFYDRLEHYMERENIKEENRKSVEIAIMVEAGANVGEMGVTTKGYVPIGFTVSTLVSSLKSRTRALRTIVCVLVCSIASRE
jgi:hypothetical protein